MINSLVSRWADKLRTPRAILQISPYQLDNITPPSSPPPPKNSRQLQLFRPPRSGSVFLILYLPRSRAAPTLQEREKSGEISPAQLRSRPGTIRCQIVTEKPPALSLQTSNCTEYPEATGQHARTDSAGNLSC